VPEPAAEPMEGTVQFRVRVDLGTSRPLPAPSTLRLELSDVTNKDLPALLAEHEVDVSTQHGVAQVDMPVDGKKLSEAERVSLTGRIDGASRMLSISMVPLVIAGPFSEKDRMVAARQVDQFELELELVPDYQKPKVVRGTSAPVASPVRQLDTGKPTNVEGPEPE
jgi:uncharacterized lipoprotein YbaY